MAKERVPSYDLFKQKINELDKKITETVLVRVYCNPNKDVVATQQDGSGVFTVNGGSRGIADFRGLPTGTTWTFESNGQSETISINKIYIEISLELYIYGYAINESISDPYARVTYTDDAIGIQPANGHNLGGWANTKLFQGIKPVVKTDEVGFKDLNKRDLTKCVDGSPSNISTLGNDAFVEIPAWYIHEHAEGKIKYIKIANKKLDDSYHAMHAMDNGIQRDCFHVGCFGAYNNGERMFSSSNLKPTQNRVYQDNINLCQARGKGYDMFSWFQWNFICAIFILAYKTCDSQKALGMGYVSGSHSLEENRTTFDNDFGLAGSSSDKEQMSFLWIQNLWGNQYQFIGGAKTDSNKHLMVILDGKDCSIHESDYTIVSSEGPTTRVSGYLVEMDISDSKIGFFPKYAKGGSITTNWCDTCDVYPSTYPRVGGNFNKQEYAGVTHMEFYESSNVSPVNGVGTRLVYKGGRS